MRTDDFIKKHCVGETCPDSTTATDATHMTARNVTRRSTTQDGAD